MRRTKIVATLGPATAGEAELEALLRAGVDVVRLNFSHGTQEEHTATIRRVRTLAEKLDRTVGILQDLQGPKIRTGALRGGKPVEIRKGSALAITTRPVEGTATCLSTTYRDLPHDLKPGDHILLADGNLELVVASVGAEEVRAEVLRGGWLAEHQGINLPGVALAAPALSEKDRDDLLFGAAQGVDFVALSFVRREADLGEARKLLHRQGADLPLVAKLERPEALERLPEILEACEAVMVARGDLGVEMPPERIPVLQKQIIRQANARGVPVITATQMLASMVASPRPTRAETSDVANAVLDGTDAVMLSAETAVGSYPVEAVEMTARIAAEADQSGLAAPPPGRAATSDAHAISHAARRLADELEVRAIVTFTKTGRTARFLSQDRPRVPIYAFTDDPGVQRRLALSWGVTAVCCRPPDHTEALIRIIETDLLARGLVAAGDAVVVVAATPVEPGVHTNFVKLHHIRPTPH